MARAGRGRAGLLRDGRARPVDRRAEPRRAGPPPGPGVAGRRRAGVPRRPSAASPAVGPADPATGRPPARATATWWSPPSPAAPTPPTPRCMVAAGPAGPAGGRARALGQALGQDLAGPRLAGGHGLPGPGRADRAARRSSASTWSGFGCTTCIGNSGPLLPGVSEAVAGARPVGRRRCCRATGTSRAGSTPTSG